MLREDARYLRDRGVLKRKKGAFFILRNRKGIHFLKIKVIVQLVSVLLKGIVKNNRSGQDGSNLADRR
jgi:hypothetical protein